MKIRLSLLSFIIISFLGNANAQMKRIEFSKSQVNSADIKLNPKTNITEMDPARIRPVTYQAMDNASLSSMNNGLKIGYLNERLVPTYIEGSLHNASTANRSTTAIVYEYLEAAAPAMKIKNPHTEFSVKSEEQDEIGMKHIRMQQMYNNIPVYGGEVVLHSADNKINFLNGHYYPSFELENLTPSLSVQKGEEIVFGILGKQTVYNYDMSQFGNMDSKSELVIYPYLEQFKLAYHYTVYKNIIERWEYFIDAQSGEVINKYESMCKLHNHQPGEDIHSTHGSEGALDKVFLDGSATATAKDLFNIDRKINTYQVGSKYYLIDAARDIFSQSTSKMPNNPSGVIWTINAFNTSPANDDFRYDHISSSTNQWSDKTAVSAHYNGGQAYDYFRNTHNRKSINGTGGNIISFINVVDEEGRSMGNAFWNGQAMFYGNGDSAFGPLAKGLDVAGHEMTHGVVQATANLDYEGESGALNESFADVFGVMIDRDDWLIGDDVVNKAVFPSGALRSMSDPHNGAKTNDFNGGWQPRHYDERYKGTQDGGGVHINSGIPNYAFYKFATAIGKDKAEKVYYRALSNYLTKSSKFVDCRVAVVKAATDLYTKAEIDAAKKAFDEVGIFGDKGGNYENDVDSNPGTEFVLLSGPNFDGLYITDVNAKELAKLSSKSIYSKPSISDDGSEIVFIGSDKKMYYIQIDWVKGTFLSEQVLSDQPIWRNVVISKDGTKLAALLDKEENKIYVFNFAASGTTQKAFELYNPTYSTGVKTGDVKFADAMEFNLSGEYLIYDAENELRSTTSGSIQYWDISFIKVWNNASNDFATGEVSKLYSSLPDGTSIGNPSFSKNSPYIIAFDFIDEDGSVSILGANIERGETGLIFENNELGFPNYSSKDDKVVFDNKGRDGVFNVGVATLKTNKIEVAKDPILFTQSRRWATWFSNGKRKITSVSDLNVENQLFTINNNPVGQKLAIQVNQDIINANPVITITDMAGQSVLNTTLNQLGNTPSVELNTTSLQSGMYIVTMRSGLKVQSLKFIKQ